MLAVLLVGVTAGAAWGQGSVQIWSGKKGSSANPGPITADDVDANTRALHVILKGSNSVTITGTATVSGTVTANQGTAAAGSGAWPMTMTTTGDVIVKPGDSGNNAVRVNCVVGCGSSSFADSSAFTFATTAVSNISAVVDDVSTNTVAENSAGAVRMSGSRILYTNLRASGGGELIGQTTMSASVPVTLASNQTALAVSESGTWTVQPGNTANTTPWLVISGGGVFGGNNQQAVTASAVALGSQSAKRVCVQALLANQIDVFIGSSSGVTTANGFPLTPGSSWCGTLSNSNLVFVIASATGASVAWAAEN